MDWYYQEKVYPTPTTYIYRISQYNRNVFLHRTLFISKPPPPSLPHTPLYTVYSYKNAQERGQVAILRWSLNAYSLYETPLLSHGGNVYLQSVCMYICPVVQ